MKQRLQRSQFTLGNSKNDFSTDYNMEYYDKSSLNNLSNANERKAIRDKLRGSNYEVGNVQSVMDGNINDFMKEYLKMISKK